MFRGASHGKIFTRHKNFRLGSQKTGQVWVRTLPRAGALESQ